MCPVFWNVYSHFKIGHTSFFVHKRNAVGGNADYVLFFEIDFFCLSRSLIADAAVWSFMVVKLKIFF